MNPKVLSIIALCLVVIAGSIVLLNGDKGEDSPPPDARVEAVNTRVSDLEEEFAPARRPGGIDPSETAEARRAMEARALVERDRMKAQWLKQASAGFGQTRKNLVVDLGLADGQAKGVENIFARREKELASLLASMTSGEAGKEIVNRICALIRNKGLSRELAGTLSQEQLKAFEASEAKRELEAVEARAYRDMADLNAVVRLTDPQKQQVLGALLKKSPEKLEKEADARAFMSLTYGPMATDMDSSHIHWLVNMMNESQTNEGPFPDIASAEFAHWVIGKKGDRIKNEIATLRDVLDEDQLARYREHLEEELP
jgi:hypothetical protein